MLIRPVLLLTGLFLGIVPSYQTASSCPENAMAAAYVMAGDAADRGTFDAALRISGGCSQGE